LGERIAALNHGIVPILEKDLPELVRAGLATGRLSFGSDNVAKAAEADFVFLCISTPLGAGGQTELSSLEAVAAQVGTHLKPGAIVVNKSTVPMGATRRLANVLGRPDVAVVSNPEFLSEGTAVFDFLHPERIVVGADDDIVAARVGSLYAGLGVRILYTNPASAELVKYASNAFLATKVTFINAIADLCETTGADVREVAAGMGLDTRIGTKFLQPGPGWGGSCLPKDTLALVRISDDHGYDFRLLKEVIATNQDHFARLVDRVARLAGGIGIRKNEHILPGRSHGGVIGLHGGTSIHQPSGYLQRR